MKLFRLIPAVVGLAAVFAATHPAPAGDGLLARKTACADSWYEPYYNPAWGMPLALVVPPTAHSQTHWGWGVGNTRVTTIYPQFRAGWPGCPIYDRSAFQPTPPVPTDTDQFGVYYVRGPWRNGCRSGY